MSESRHEHYYSLAHQNGRNEEEPRTPEPSPPTDDDEHDLPTVRVAHQYNQNQPLTLTSARRCDQSTEDDDEDLMDLGLILPVLEEAEANMTPRTPSPAPPLRFAPSARHAQFCEATLPALRQFQSVSDPRSVMIPHHDDNLNRRQYRPRHERQRSPQNDNNQEPTIPESLCVPDIDRDMEGDEEWDTGYYSVRLCPKKRRRER